MNKAVLWSMIAAVLAVAVQPALAIDEVIRKSGQTSVKGNVTEVSKDGIVVKATIGNNTTTVPANDIAKVRWTSEPAKLNLARGNEEGGRLDVALKGYQEAADDAHKNLVIQVPG